MKTWHVLIVAALAVAVAVAVYALTGKTREEASDLGKFVRGRRGFEEEPAPPPKRMTQVREAYDPITRVETIAASSAAGKVDDGESVLGVVVADQARAYPLNMMAEPQQEVLNDSLGGLDLAVTFCSRCKDARVFDRRCEGRPLTFYVPGILLGGSMVIADKETHSAWSQVLGVAESGTLEGRSLAAVPSVVTDWKSWREQHPQTTVAILPRLSTAYSHREAFGKGTEDPYVLGYRGPKTARAWSLDLLRSRLAIADLVDDKPLLAAFDEATQTAGLFSRVVDGQVLEIVRDGPTLRDAHTRSEWDAASGRAVRGPLRGKRLPREPGFVILKVTWLDFHKKSTLRSPDAGRP